MPFFSKFALALLFAGVHSAAGQVTECTVDVGGVTTPCPLATTEGPILSVSEGLPQMILGNDEGVTVSIMGATVFFLEEDIEAGTITSGAGVPLTLNDIVNTASLPGRPESGFIGATCKCEIADSDPYGSITGAMGSIIGRECILEAAENVMTALVTANTNPNDSDTDCSITIGNALTVTPNTDARYIFGGAVDLGGFPIHFCSIPVGTSIAAEGYYSDTLGLVISSVEAEAGTRISTVTEFGIGRIRCRDNDRFEIRGSVSDDTLDSISILASGSGALIGSTVPSDVADPEEPNVFPFSLRNRGFNSDCPDAIELVGFIDGVEVVRGEFDL